MSSWHFLDTLLCCLLTFLMVIPTALLIRQVGGFPAPGGFLKFKDGPLEGVDKYTWSSGLSGVPRDTLMMFFAACNIAAILGIWTDSILGMGGAAGVCLIIMYTSVAITFTHVGSRSEVPLPVALALLNVMRLYLRSHGLMKAKDD